MRSRAERARLIVVAAYLAAVLHALGASDIVGDDEAREAGIVQDIVAGHVLLPRFNADLLPDKPTLYHWLAALPCAAAGFSEAAVRLPAALAATGLVAWTASAGTDLFGARAGLVAAALLATMPALFDHARAARPDTLLVLLLSVALGAAFRWWRDGRRGDATAALALLGASVLAKGPVGVVLFAITLTGFLLWQGDLRRLSRFFTVPGVIAFCVLGLGWYAVALGGWGELFVRQHLVGRYLRNLAGGLVSGHAYSPRPLRYHLLFYPTHLVAVVLPWTPFAAIALWRAWRGGRFGDPRVRFLVCWTLAPVVAFTPAEWKLRHYLLPSLPAVALLTAPTVVEILGTPLRAAFGGARSVAAAVVALAGITAALAVAARPDLLSRSDARILALLPLVPGGLAGAAALAGLAVGIVAGTIALGAWSVLVGALAVAMAAWLTLGMPALEQATSRRESLRPFARGVAARYPPPAPLVFHGPAVRPVVVYLGRTVPEVRDVPPGVGVIGRQADYLALARAGIVAAPLLVGEGRLGNLERGRLVLAESRPPP